MEGLFSFTILLHFFSLAPYIFICGLNQILESNNFWRFVPCLIAVFDSLILPELSFSIIFPY